MLCDENTPVLSGIVLASDFPPAAAIIAALVIAIIGLIFLHVSFAIEACIQRNSKQLLEQTVMREEAPDYYLGEDTKYYTYIPAEDDKPPTNAPLPPDNAAAAGGSNENKPVDEALESAKKPKENEKK